MQMAMTELELSKKLGIILEPEENHVEVTESLVACLHTLRETFREQDKQRFEMGSIYEELWLELLPWHSLN